MKKVISLMLVFAMIFGTLSGCQRSEDVTNENSGLVETDKPAQRLSLAEQTRIASNNIQNNVHFASDGEYLFCGDWDDGMNTFPYIYKVSMDDFSVELKYDVKMSYGAEFNPENVFCVDNTLYYYNAFSDILIKLNTDMLEKMELPFSETYNCIQTDGTYYFVSDWSFFFDHGIYRVDVADINEETKNQKSHFTKISDIYASKLILQGDYLYVWSRAATINDVENENVGVWRMDLDGGNPICIMDYVPEFLLVSESRIYSVEGDNCVYSMDLDGLNRHVLPEVSIDAKLATTSINITDDYIFYSHKEDGTLHRTNIDGTNDVQMNMCESGEIAVCGEWIIYLNEEEHNYYKMHVDGTCHCLISEALIEEEST